MMNPIRSPLFFRLYRFLPHSLFNTLGRWLVQARRPRWAVQLVIRKWIEWKGIEMDDFEETDYSTVEDFFLRRLHPDARPLGAGFVSPVDGNFMAVGAIEKDTILQVKGQPISVHKMINSKLYDLPLDAFEGGTYITIFLTPNGYHRLHMPCDAELQQVQWIPGRTFPQNEEAIHHIPGIYERNERAVVSCVDQAGAPFLMVLVGASLIGGIHLTALPRKQWVNTTPTRLSKELKKGDEFAHFSFGSTIVMLSPKDLRDGNYPPIGSPLQMGQSLHP